MRHLAAYTQQACCVLTCQLGISRRSVGQRQYLHVYTELIMYILVQGKAKGEGAGAGQGSTK